MVDDEAGIREVLRAFIEKAGHRVLEAMDASSARRILAKESVDLAFLDVLMPGESGVDLCHSIKDDPECSRIKVVLMTGFDDERAWQQGLRCGADLFAVKPLAQERVQVLLDELLGPQDEGLA